MSPGVDHSAATFVHARAYIHILSFTCLAIRLRPFYNTTFKELVEQIDPSTIFKLLYLFYRFFYRAANLWRRNQER